MKRLSNNLHHALYLVGEEFFEHVPKFLSEEAEIYLLGEKSLLLSWDAPEVSFGFELNFERDSKFWFRPEREWHESVCAYSGLETGSLTMLLNRANDLFQYRKELDWSDDEKNFWSINLKIKVKIGAARIAEKLQEISDFAVQELADEIKKTFTESYFKKLFEK